jgi:hypothetical protein
MAETPKLGSTKASVYEKLLSQIELGYYSGHIRLNSVEFNCPEDAKEYPMEPIDNVDISWKCSFEKIDIGFRADVILRNEIESDDEGDSIRLNIGYSLYYTSKMDLPDSLADKFAHDKVLPQVWPYFREYARELYFKAGLKWVLIPFEPKVVDQ